MARFGGSFSVTRTTQQSPGCFLNMNLTIIFFVFKRFIPCGFQLKFIWNARLAHFLFIFSSTETQPIKFLSVFFAMKC